MVTRKFFVLLVMAAMCMLSAKNAFAAETWKDKRLTLEFKNTPLEAVLDALADKAGLSYSVSKDTIEADITITAKLKDIPVQEAVEGLMKAAGLEYTLSEHGFLSVYLSSGTSTEQDDREKT